MHRQNSGVHRKREGEDETKMSQKNELLKKCANIFKQTHIEMWYRENLHGKPQYDTINALEKGVQNKELGIKEALSIALIVGVQWNVKFEGVP